MIKFLGKEFQSNYLKDIQKSKNILKWMYVGAVLKLKWKYEQNGNLRLCMLFSEQNYWNQSIGTCK